MCGGAAARPVAVAATLKLGVAAVSEVVVGGEVSCKQAGCNFEVVRVAELLPQRRYGQPA